MRLLDTSKGYEKRKPAYGEQAKGRPDFRLGRRKDRPERGILHHHRDHGRENNMGFVCSQGQRKEYRTPNSRSMFSDENPVAP